MFLESWIYRCRICIKPNTYAHTWCRQKMVYKLVISVYLCVRLSDVFGSQTKKYFGGGNEQISFSIMCLLVFLNNRWHNVVSHRHIVYDADINAIQCNAVYVQVHRKKRLWIDYLGCWQENFHNVSSLCLTQQEFKWWLLWISKSNWDK